MTQDERWCTLDGRYVAQYCSPMDVARAIRIIDYSSEDLKIWEPSDSSIPSWDELIFRISAKENEIDTYLGMSWRCNRMVDQVVNLGTYWHDINGYRTEYWVRGGYSIQLEQDIRQWDPSQGDRIYLRNIQNAWIDKTSEFYDCDDQKSIGWIDYKAGVLHVRAGYLNPKANSVKVTYRYGRTDPVPAHISRCCALMVGLTILNEDLYLTRLGQGGDLGGQKNDQKKAMQDEINAILTSNRRFTSVYSLLP